MTRPRSCASVRNVSIAGMSIVVVSVNPFAQSIVLCLSSSARVLPALAFHSVSPVDIVRFGARWVRLLQTRSRGNDVFTVYNDFDPLKFPDWGNFPSPYNFPQGGGSYSSGALRRVFALTQPLPC